MSAGLLALIGVVAVTVLFRVVGLFHHRKRSEYPKRVK